MNPACFALRSKAGGVNLTLDILQMLESQQNVKGKFVPSGKYYKGEQLNVACGDISCVLIYETSYRK